MRKLYVARTLQVALLLGAGGHGALLAQSAQTPGVLEDVRHLADDRLEGRRVGTPGADSAAAYIAARFETLGLRQAPSLGGWLQSFIVSPEAPAVRGTALAGVRGTNVIGLLSGRDPVLRDEYVVIGAHYDHLGLGGPGSLDPDSVGVVHNGADDNASGVAALLDIARRLVRTPPARSVLFIAFGGEELGLLGSAHYIRQPVVPNDRIVAMLNFDMVGRLRDERLVIYGVETATEWRALLDSLNARAGFALTAQGDGYGPSDHTSFTMAGRPVLHFFTGTHEDYHRTTDDWGRINVEGVERIAAFATELAAAIGHGGTSLTFVDRPPPAPTARGGGGYGAYFGSIPDMTDNPGGVRLAGVRAESPAERAGLRAGDIVTRIGEFEVADLQGMTVALRSHRPGETVRVVFRRDGAEQTVLLTFGSRGG